MKTTRVMKMALLAAVGFSLCQCSNSDGEAAGDKASAKAPAEIKMAYIDSDSLFAKYNFAKDITEAGQRSQNKYDSAYRQKATEIQRRQADIENKARNNGYLTQSSDEADLQSLQQLQADAERYMQNLQQQIVNETSLSTKQVNDSINKCVNEYAEKHGISVVLDKKTTWYVNNLPDITDDLVKILNDRYLKVEKK